MGMTTVCMGLTLKNPLIVASSGLVRSVSGVTKCAEAGAGAVVLKSLFEEQFEAEARGIAAGMPMSPHPEAADYIDRMSRDLGPEAYLKFVSEAKAAVDIPIIASLNCVTPHRWPDYAERVVGAGADAVELNVAIMTSAPDVAAATVEDGYLRIIDAVRGRVPVPLAVKIGPQFTSVANMAARCADHGVAALVLFNRFYQPDFDVHRIELTIGPRFSTPAEVTTALRWVSLLFGRVGCDLIGATGIHDGEAVVKLILAGATAVQVASAIYLHGWSRIGEMLDEVERWLAEKGFSSLGEVRGRLSQVSSPHPEVFERYQYIKAISGLE